MSTHAIVYSTDNCPFCRLAKDLLKAQGISFDEIHVDQEAGKREEMIQLTNRRTVPQIFINNQHIGGYDDLVAFIKSGKLKNLTTE